MNSNYSLSQPIQQALQFIEECTFKFLDCSEQALRLVRRVLDDRVKETALQIIREMQKLCTQVDKEKINLAQYIDISEDSPVYKLMPLNGLWEDEITAFQVQFDLAEVKEEKQQAEIRIQRTQNANPSNPLIPGFETYIDTWSANWKEMIDKMPLQNGMSIDIAFSDWGNPLDAWVESNLVAIERELQMIAKQKGVTSLNLKLSFGGETYAMPRIQNVKEAEEVALKLIQTLKYYQDRYGIAFNGVDLDVEDKGNDAKCVAEFIQKLRGQLDSLGGSRKSISLTIPGQAWTGFYHDLSSNPNVHEAVDYIQFMEYHIWKADGITIRKQIENDILTYSGPQGTDSPNPGQPCWGIPIHKIRLGIRPGFDGQHYITPEDARLLTQFAVNKGLSGVMIWNAYRDGGIQDEMDKGQNNGRGGSIQRPFVYTQTILSELQKH